MTRRGPSHLLFVYPKDTYPWICTFRCARASSDRPGCISRSLIAQLALRINQPRQGTREDNQEHPKIYTLIVATQVGEYAKSTSVL